MVGGGVLERAGDAETSPGLQLLQQARSLGSRADHQPRARDGDLAPPGNAARLGSWKELRRLGATLLAGHQDYGRLQAYFLGHSPRTAADRHDVRPSREVFAEAVTWLGRELGPGGSGK